MGLSARGGSAHARSREVVGWWTQLISSMLPMHFCRQRAQRRIASVRCSYTFAVKAGSAMCAFVRQTTSAVPAASVSSASFGVVMRPACMTGSEVAAFTVATASSHSPSGRAIGPWCPPPSPPVSER